MIESIHTSGAPEAIGPYSQAVRCGDWLLLSGQIPLDPTTGVMVTGEIVAQTEQVMANLAAVLHAAGIGWSQVVRTTIFLVDLNDFAVVNQVYGRHVQPPYPARATVQAAALPRGALVEMDAMAWLGG